jgi:hypothetical protein
MAVQAYFLKMILHKLKSYLTSFFYKYPVNGDGFFMRARGVLNFISYNINIMNFLGELGFFAQSTFYNEMQKAFKSKDKNNQHTFDYKIIILGSFCALIGLALISGFSWKIFFDSIFLKDLNQRLKDLNDGWLAIKNLSTLCYSAHLIIPAYFIYQRISSFISLNINLLKTAVSSIEELFDSYLTPQSFMHRKIEFFAGHQLDLNTVIDIQPESEASTQIESKSANSIFHHSNGLSGRSQLFVPN